jgi:hypothetical protein
MATLTEADAAAGTTYPWCAQYMVQSGAKNCGFSTFAQCLADVSGIGGTCAMNPFFVQQPPAPSRARQRTRP